MEENQEQENTEELVGASGNLMDSKTSHLDDLLYQKLSNALHQQSFQVLVHDVAKIVSEHSAVDLAYAIDRLPVDMRYVIYQNLRNLEDKAVFVESSSRVARVALLRQIDDEEIVELLDQMPSDEAVSVLEDISTRRLKQIFELLDGDKAARIISVFRYERHTAGRLMMNDFFAFPMDATIGEVSQIIRENPGVDLTRRIFVLNDAEELVGFVPSRNLIVNANDLPLKQVMRPILYKVLPEASRDEVVDVVERYKVSALPVVDQKEHLLGVITYEDVVEAVEDIADDTIASIAGTAEEIGEYEPIFWRFMWRAPWLLVTLFAGLVTATNMSYFKDRSWFIFVPFFVPLITGMSGNVGIQSSTTLVRGMSTGEISAGARSDAVRQELSIGLLAGAVFGLLCGLVVYALGILGIHHIGQDPFAVASVISCGILGACLTATTLGTFSPLFFARLRIDPAIAAGPIVTALNDVLSTLIFFLVCWAVQSLFFL